MHRLFETLNCELNKNSLGHDLTILGKMVLITLQNSFCVFIIPPPLAFIHLEKGILLIHKLFKAA